MPKTGCNVAQISGGYGPLSHQNISLAKISELFTIMKGPRISTQTQRTSGVLTEKEVSASWRALFKGGNYSEETFAKAEELLDELRLESPLRHRLSGELEELRRLQVAEG